MSRTNYHSHTYYCGHSENEPEKLIRLAIQRGYKVFGFSEHLPIPKTRWTPTDDEINELINKVNSLREKYKNDIHIYMGLECEWHPIIYDRIKKLHKRDDIEYLIFGNHFLNMNHNYIEYIHFCKDKDELLNKQYQYAKSALSSGLFSCFAHPDIFLHVYKKWDEKAIWLTQKFIELSIKYDVPLEININGYKVKKLKKDEFYYPYENFWKEVSKSNCKVIIGIDTHTYDVMSDEYFIEINNLIDNCNLRKNLVKNIKDKNNKIMD